MTSLIRKILIVSFILSVFLLTGCKSYKPEEVKNVDCGTISKEDAMKMCLDMVEKCSVPANTMTCYQIYNYISGGETLCKIAKKIEREQCKH